MARTRNSSKKPPAHNDFVSAPLSAVAPLANTGAPAENPAPPRADRLGVELRKARNALGLTPRQCEEVLRVKEEYLLALENGHYHLLPTTAHAKGFLRSYAQYLGLGNQLAELQTRFLEETQGLPLAPHLVMPAALPEAKLPTLKFIGGGLLAAIVVAVLYVSFSAPPAPAPAPEPVMAKEAPAVVDKTVEKAAPVSNAATMPAPEVADATTPVIAEASVVVPPQDLPAPNKQGVAIRATDNVWVQVQDKSGATIFSRLLRKGEEIPAPAGEGLTLTAGNGAGIQLVLGGAATRPIGAKAEVVRGISLDAKNIAARLKAPEPKPKPVTPKPLATIAPAVDAVAVPAAPPATTTDPVNEE